jgi:hypothetical protein
MSLWDKLQDANEENVGNEVECCISLVKAQRRTGRINQSVNYGETA